MLRLFNSFNKIKYSFSYKRYFAETPLPEYLIEWEDTEGDLSVYQPAYLTDFKRMEIYNKHKNDPIEWNIYNISKRYGLSITRTRGILFLMEKRIKLMEKLGVYNLSIKWEEIYSDYISEPEVNTKEVLAEKYSLSIEEIENILKNMDEHTWRKANLNDSNAYHDEVLDHLEFMG